MPKTRSKLGVRVLRNAGLVVVSVSLALLMAEAATRILTDTPPPLLLRNADIGNHYLPSFEGEVFTDESGKRTHLRFNPLGFRGPDWSIEKPAGTSRVVLLGDSMIAALAVEEPLILSSTLQTSLTSTTGRPWQVLNFGVSASSPGQELVLYRKLASKYAPDLVVAAFFVGNDLSDSSREMDNYPRIYLELDEAGNLRQRPFGAGRAGASTWLNQHSRFYVWQKTTINRALHVAEASRGARPERYYVYDTDPPERAERAWALIEKVYATLRAEAEAQCARFAVVVLPSGRMIYPEGFDEVRSSAGELAAQMDRDEPDRRIEALCARQGLSCLSLTPHLRAALEGDPLYFNRTGHLTARGQEVARAALTPWLRQLADRPLDCPKAR